MLGGVVMQIRKTATAIIIAGIMIAVPVQAKKVTIMWSDHTRNTKQNVEALIADFEKLNPNIQVKWQPMNGWDIDKIITMITANSAPDVFWTYGDYLATLTEAGLTVDFSKYTKNAGLNKNLEDMSPTLVKNFWVGKRLIAMPKYAGTMALAYSKNMFDMAGVPVPTNDWDWNDIIEYGQKLVKRDANAKVTRYGFATAVDDLSEMFIYQNGGQIIPQGELLGSKLLTDNPKTVQAMEFLHSLIWKYRIMPATDQSVFAFLDRKIAMSSVASWDVDLFKAYKDEWNIVEMPKGPTGERATYHCLDGYVIPRNTKHINEALKFVAFLTSARSLSAYLTGVDVRISYIYCSSAMRKR